MIDANSVPRMPEKDKIHFDGDPIPLTKPAEIPAFPIDSLPGPIGEMVRAVSEATQTDPAMAATSALSVLSACTGGHGQIEIRSGWREPLNLYIATIAAPGERKSAVQMTMVRPILDVEARLAEKGFAARLEAETRKQIAARAAEKLKGTAAAAGQTGQWDNAMADAIGAAQIAESIEVPPIPRLVADDITPEAATLVLAEQRGRLAIISAEGGIFDIIAGRYSRNIANMDLWLKGHSGDPLKVDRIGRPPQYVRRPALTIGLMIQPAVLRAIAANPEFRGRGLLARFLYSWPVSKVGRRKIAPTPVDSVIIERYEDTVTSLISGMVGWVDDPAVLTLSDKAHAAIIRLEEAVEPTLAEDGELAPLADWGAKYVGAVARIAGILHLAEHGHEQGIKTPVSAQSILAACRVGAYFKASAINAFVRMGADQDSADAIYLLQRIARLGHDEVSERELHAATQSRFKKKADLTPVLERLLDHGYLAPMPAAKPTGGRPASPRYKVHPDVTQATKETEC